MTDKSRFFVVPPGDGEDLTASSGSVRLKLTAAPTRHSFSLLEVNSLPNDGPPLHRHLPADEIFYVLDGNYWFECDGERVDVSTGSLVFVPRGASHRYDTLTGGRLLIMFTPAGSEGFFSDWARLDRETAGVIEPGDLARLASGYGIELLAGSDDASEEPNGAHGVDA
ncbi:MAG: cupin domain-containing protein [Actinomycetota bacterium]